MKNNNIKCEDKFSPISISNNEYKLSLKCNCHSYIPDGVNAPLHKLPLQQDTSMSDSADPEPSLHSLEQPLVTKVDPLVESTTVVQ